MTKLINKIAIAINTKEADIVRVVDGNNILCELILVEALEKLDMDTLQCGVIVSKQDSKTHMGKQFRRITFTIDRSIDMNPTYSERIANVMVSGYEYLVGGQEEFATEINNGNEDIASIVDAQMESVGSEVFEYLQEMVDEELEAHNG